MKKIYFDSELCMGCHSCEFACAVEHSKGKNPATAHLAEDKAIPRRNVQQTGGMCLTVGCRHCEAAPCVDACMAGAMTQDPASGQVTCDEDMCVSCWMCVMVCPFDAVKPGSTYSVKCDMCPDREAPACIEACPTKALFEAGPEDFQKKSNQRKARHKKLELRR